MNDIQFATTLVAPTGTGLLVKAYGQDADSALWKEGASVSRQEIQLRRMRPKPTPVHAGVHRFEFKRTSYTIVNAVEYPIITTVTSAIPVVATLATRQAVFLHIALMARDPVFQNAIETDVLPT